MLRSAKRRLPPHRRASRRCQMKRRPQKRGVLFVYRACLDAQAWACGSDGSRSREGRLRSACTVPGLLAACPVTFHSPRHAPDLQRLALSFLIFFLLLRLSNMRLWRGAAALDADVGCPTPPACSAQCPTAPPLYQRCTANLKAPWTAPLWAGTTRHLRRRWLHTKGRPRRGAVARMLPRQERLPRPPRRPGARPVPACSPTTCWWWTAPWPTSSGRTCSSCASGSSCAPSSPSTLPAG